MSDELSGAKEYYSWILRQFELNDKAQYAKTRLIRRGQVYWCEFGINIGNEISKSSARPAIVLQSNSGNFNSPNTIVVPVTHNTGNQFFLVPLVTQYNPDGSVLLDGKVNVTNIMCMSKARLGNFITWIPRRELRAIESALRIVLGLK